MSVVTNLLLVCSSYDALTIEDARDGTVVRRYQPGLDRVRAWCEGETGTEEHRDSIDLIGWPSAAVDAVSGGTKHMECGLYAWGANYLAFDEFMEVVRTAPRRHPTRVQVVVKEQDDDVFTTYTLSEIRTWRRWGPPSTLERYRIIHLES